ncbi:MAG: hypothetical protein A3H43_04470 [Gammaproteobacteria bacterium RIFCSPLOWO2_02_FULL_42_9]|nr:MAG: hypothetical protein A3H43_04470 [Gammaproteobacteria bacterium RIFCSPLOWO2_02_FULL_42_9]
MFSRWMMFFAPEIVSPSSNDGESKLLSQLSAELREFIPSIVEKIDQRAPLTFGELVHQHDMLAVLNRYDRLLKATKDPEKILNCVRAMQTKFAGMLNLDAHEKLIHWENQLEKLLNNQDDRDPRWLRYLSYK